MKNKKSSFKLLFSFLLGILFVGGVVYAATTVASSTVTYSNSKSGLSSTTVQGAINELYTKTKSSAPSINALPNIVAAYKYSKATATKCTTGNESTCVVTYCYTSSASGSCEPGTIIKYKVNDSEIKTFNVISDKGDTIDMQSLDVIVDAIWSYSTNANGPVHSMSLLNGSTKNWTNVNDQNYIMGSYGTSSTCGSYHACYSNAYSLTVKGKARMITVQEAATLGCTQQYGSCPEWLDSDVMWTMNTFENSSTEVWAVCGHFQYLQQYRYDSEMHIRAVVNINKPV